MAPAGGRELPETPSWAVAVFFAVMILVSVLMKHALHTLDHWFHHRHKNTLAEALEKMKTELMLAGFISVLLTVVEDPISKICISEKAGSIMLPCKLPSAYAGDGGDGKDNGRRLLWLQGEVHRRFLAAPAGEDVCAKQGKVPLMSAGSMHQLHIFIFVLAVFHVTYSVITMALSRLKMKIWENWDAKTAPLENQIANDPWLFRSTPQTSSFVKEHQGFSPRIRWVVAFFRHWFRSVIKVDYLTLRQVFINAQPNNSKFDFHDNIKRSMEADFKVVVGIRLHLWFVAILALFLDIEGTDMLTWISFIPLVILLCVGTKLEMIIMEMAQEIEDQASDNMEVSRVEPNDKFFWFHRPDWVLFFIHLTLFLNAFQMAHFVWTVASPGLKECFHQHIGLSIKRVVMGVAVQIMCSYTTLPLYALVTQAKVTQVKEKKEVRDTDMLGDATPSRGTFPVPSRGSSSVHVTAQTSTSDVAYHALEGPAQYQAADPTGKQPLLEHVEPRPSPSCLH